MTLGRRVVLAAPWLWPVAAGAQAPGRAPPQVQAPARAPAAPAPESLGLSGARLGQATEVLAHAVTEGRINGAVFGVMRQGKPAWLQAVGFRDTAQAERLKVDAVFPLAGLTVPVAAVAAMVLVERGRLKLTDPLAAHLPAFRELRVAVEARNAASGLIDLTFERARRPVTVHDLLRQTAGFAAADGSTTVGRMYLEAGVAAADQALAAAMATLAPLPLLHQPGSAWEDSVAPDVLARVVEVVSGQGFDRFLAAQVTGPLKMADTGYALAPAVQGRVAMPAVDPLTGAPPPSPDGRGVPVRMGGAGGLFSTAGDMLRFGQALLGGGALDGARVLGAGTVALMLGDHLGRISRETASGAYLLGEGRGYGLGLSVRLGAGVSPMPGSAGDVEWMGTTGCQLVVDPEREMVAVLMVNQASQFDHLFRLFRTLVYQGIVK